MKSQTKQVNTFLLEQAAVHLLAAVGEDVKQAKVRDNPMDFLYLMLSILYARGYTLSEVVSIWNDVVEGKE
jgi:site-specific recombinase XerD